MFRRVTSVAASALMMSSAAIALTPAAHAAPETYTGHLQVIVGDTIVGCARPGGDWAGHTTDTTSAFRVSITSGPQQDLTILDTQDGPTDLVLGVSDEWAAYPMNQHSMGYTFLHAIAPVPAGSPSVNRKQSAVWSVDPATSELSATYVWDDMTSGPVTTLQYDGGDYLGLTADATAVGQTFPAFTPATFRIGETCSGTIRTAQAITFTSAAPSPAHPGQTYTVEATGGGSGNPVTFSSATTDHCTVDGSTVTFGEPGTCRIEADQAAATGYTAAPTVSQQITVSLIPTSLDLDLAPANVVTGQGTTATARIAVETGSIKDAGGLVQFRVNGKDLEPVAFDSDGRAVTNAIRTGVGTHQVEAIWWPEDNYVYDAADDAATLTVSPADTTTKVTVTGTELSATVEPVAPGAGTPTGRVTFRVDGVEVGGADLVDGRATLAHSVPADRTRVVSAEYTGDGEFTASSTSTSRSNPTVTARVTSSSKKRNGWYRKPVKISFQCTTNGSALATVCPAPVTVRKQGSSTVTRTVRAADGGVATVSAAVKVDRTKPRVGIKGVKRGRSYFDAPRPKCVAKDRVSGVKKCKLTSKRRGGKVVVTAKARDAAGNVRTKRVAYRISNFTIRGAKKVGGTWHVRHGKTYTLEVRGAKPTYRWATPAPGRPYAGSAPFRKIGKNRWALGVTMSMTTSATRSWNLGYTQGGKLRVVRVKVTG